jgi:hypothetical protein
MTLLAAFNVLMHRYTGQEDICVGHAYCGSSATGTRRPDRFFCKHPRVAQ